MMFSFPARSSRVSSERPRRAALGLGDRARRHAGESGEIRLAEVTGDPEAAERRAEPSRGRRGGEHGQPVLEAVPEDASLDAGRPSLGLGDPEPPVADDEHALRDPLDLAPQGRRVTGRRKRPVGDRAEPEQQRAAS